MDDISATCLALGRSLGFEEKHSLQDARLALRLFDLLQNLHGLNEACRRLLHCAALLHDIGYVEGYPDHHKAAYRLILAAELPGLTVREKQIVANVARYHRGARPSLEHEGYAMLGAEDREIVIMLGAILRLADGLDRSHTDAVRDVDVSLDGERLLVAVECLEGCDDEIWAGEKKGRWLEDVLGVRLEVRQRGGNRRGS